MTASATGYSGILIVDEAVQQVLRAKHAVEIWNFDDAVLRQAAKRAETARSEDLRRWIAARLSHRAEWASEFADVVPIWPKAVPFPISIDAERGAIGFVSAIPESAPALPVTERRDDELTETAQRIVGWLTRDLALEWPGKMNLVAHVWVPMPTHGRSVGLAALMAGLVGALAQTDPRLRDISFFFPMTGEIDLASELLLPVDEDTLPGKRAAAKRIGAKEIYVAGGQASHGNGLRSVALDTRLRSQTLKRLLQELARVNPILYEGFHLVQRMTGRLIVPLDDLSQFLPGVLSRLTDDLRDIQSVRANLNLPRDPNGGSAIEHWDRLVDEYVHNQADKASLRNAIRLCYWMLERNDDEPKRRDLQALAVRVTKKDYHGTLLAEKAITDLTEVRKKCSDAEHDESSELEVWFRMCSIAAAVRIKDQAGFLSELVASNDDAWRALAVYAATRLYGWTRGQCEGLRKQVGIASKDREQFPDRLKHVFELISVPCRTDFAAMFSTNDPGAWARQRRAKIVQMRRFPVTNLEYE